MIFVTGASSYIGTRLLVQLEQLKHPIKSLGRKSTSNDEFWKIGLPINGTTNDTLIYLANDRNISSSEAIVLYLEVLRSFKGHIIYLGSFSGVINSRSNYGKTKYFLKELTILSGNTVVIAGMFHHDNKLQLPSALSFVSRYFRVKLLWKNRECEFFVTEMDKLISIIVNEVEHPSRREIYCHEASSLTLSSILSPLYNKFYRLPLRVNLNLLERLVIVFGKFWKIPKSLDPLLSLCSENYHKQFEKFKQN
jgi:hypothetical protein